LANKQADQNPQVARISIDSKARVKLGNLSREGKSRTKKPLQANDHDYNWSQSLVPFGILDLTKEQLSIYFGTSSETSDFIVDCLSMWWQNNRQNYSELEELVINLDNGVSHRSNRTQFIKRIVNFSLNNKLKIRLVYYPPYHSKYNSIERCWGVLENYWHGAILDTVSAAINWASNMTWKSKHPHIHLIDNTYNKGITIPSSELQFYQQFWQPSENLPKWDVTIVPL
jgi:hypothetical protein